MVTSECGKSALRAPFDFQYAVKNKIKICFQYPNFVTREQYLNQNFFLLFQQSLHIAFIYHMKLIFAPLFLPFRHRNATVGWSHVVTFNQISPSSSKMISLVKCALMQTQLVSWQDFVIMASLISQLNIMLSVVR